MKTSLTRKDFECLARLKSNPISHITERPIQKWFEKNVDPFFLYNLIKQAEKNGYAFDTDSGLLLRPRFRDPTTEQIGHTSIDIIFPRPVAWHYHKDVDEAFHVVEGNGECYVAEPGQKPLQLAFCPGYEIVIPKKTLHSFRPDKNDILEIRIESSGVLDPKKEVCVGPFYKFKPWVDYYKNNK